MQLINESKHVSYVAKMPVQANIYKNSDLIKEKVFYNPLGYAVQYVK